MTAQEMIKELEKLPSDVEVRFTFSGTKTYEFDLGELDELDFKSKLAIFDLEEF